MTTTHLYALRHALTMAASRRGVLGTLATGLLVTGSFDDTEARMRSKRNKKKRKNRRKQRRKNQKPRTLVDATCAVPYDRSFSNPNGTARFAQTFTPIASGTLLKAELKIVKLAGSLGDYVLRLSPVDGDGVPTNEVLAETVVANADVPVVASTDGASIVSFTFADAPAVRADAEYALVLSRPGGRVAWTANNDDPCAGRGFTSVDATAPFLDGPEAGNDFNLTIVIRA